MSESGDLARAESVRQVIFAEESPSGARTVATRILRADGGVGWELRFGDGMVWLPASLAYVVEGVFQAGRVNGHAAAMKGMGR